MQKYWTPNLGCNIRTDLSTGVPEYSEYLNSTSWVIRSGLRHCGGDNTVSYFGSQTRKYPKAIWPAMIKLKPESVPVYPGHETVSAYFPFGEMAVTTLIEGQLAFLHHVRTYEEAHAGTRLLQRNLCWKIESLTGVLAQGAARGDRRRSSSLVARQMAGRCEIPRPFRGHFATPLTLSLGSSWKPPWSSWIVQHPRGLSTGSHGNSFLS